MDGTHPHARYGSADVERGVEPGVERRALLRGAAALAAFGALGASARASSRTGDPPRAKTKSGGPLAYDEFLALANPLAAELVGDTSRDGQDRYLCAIAALAVRMVDVPVPEMRIQGDKMAGKTFIGANDGGEAFTVLHWRMEPNTVISDHPHTYGNVVTLVLDGEIVVRNFEVVGTRDYTTRETFQVRRTCESVLTPGGINLVSLERNYTHGFRAGPKGARGLDITTRIREKHPNLSLDLVSKPPDDAFGVYEARWKH
ncbi:MAG: hypothetical protein ACKVWV_14080 [Planctomycetota bacterium]